MVSIRKKFWLFLLLVISTACFALSTGTAMAITADEPIAGYSMVTAAQMEAELSAVNPGHIHPEIAQLYVYWGSRFGIKADLAFAQMLNETGYLRYGGDVRPEQNNFAGIGATGGGNPGNSFPTAEAGVIAHYAHLAWYVYPNHVNDYCNLTWDPRHFGTGHINSVRTLRDLGGRWAVPGTTYGSNIAQIATRIWGLSDPDYTTIPVIGDIRSKWFSLNGAPRLPLNAEYRVPASGDPWLAQAQDFTNGRLICNLSTGGTYWTHGAIITKYDALGGETGFLGLPISDEFAVSGGRAQNFTHGSIYWSAATGAYELHGDILAKFVALGGTAVLGFPTTDELDLAGITNGKESRFTNGRIYFAGANTAHEVRGDICAKYLALGGPTVVGLPITDEMSSGPWGGRESSFQNDHRIYWSAAGGAHMISGDMQNKYLALGGADIFGVPTTDVFAIAGITGAQECDFQIGRFYSSASDGIHEVHGVILSKYVAAGGPTGFMGLPTSDEQNVTGVTGAKWNQFKNANIYWSAATSAHEVHGDILTKYLVLNPGVLGLPTTDETSVPGFASGRKTELSGATIYWSAATGANEVHGEIRGKWLAAGGPTGFMGLPTSDEQNVTGVTGAKWNQFKNANVYWSAATGAHEVHGAILAKYIDYGGAASVLGMPVSDEYVSGSGRRSDFQGGYIYWNAPNGAQVFVGNAGNVQAVTAATSYEARDGNGVLLATLGAGQIATVGYSKPTGTYSFQAPGVSRSGTSQVRFASSDGIMQVTSYHDVPSWNPALDDNRFRGTIEVRYSPVSDAVWVVNELPVEDYMKGIAETGSGSPTEFLKTMAVAARSYAVWHLDRGGKYGSSEIFHLKNSRNGNGDDQVYKGYGLEARFPELISAVNATSSQAVTYGGAVAMTSYFSNSDGRTRSAQEAWGIDYWPWLQSVADPDCDGMTLNGHGVGLSGYGAQKRAVRGDSYTSILAYYYSGTALQTVDTNKIIRVAITGHAV